MTEVSLKSIYIRLCSVLTLALIAIFVALTLTGCVKNEFSVQFDLPASVTATYKVVYYARDKRGGVTIETAVPVAQGKGEMKGITRLPVCVMIFEGSSLQPSAVFYAERGDKIRITGENDDPFRWRINGNSLTDALNDWRLEHSSILSLRDAKSINKAVADYVRQHPDRELSALLLALYYDRRVAGSDFDGLLKLLKGDAASEEMIALTGRHDMLSPEEAEAAKNVRLPKLIPLQSAATGCDTLYIDRGRPSLIVCRKYDGQADDVLVDSVKSLLRQYTDSSRRNIVEIYLSADSLTWTTALRRDTLRGALRARMPLELADPLMISAGIRQAPWMVVTDGKGATRYSGGDAAEASKAFRKLMKK